MHLSIAPDQVLQILKEEGVEVPPIVKRVWIEGDEIRADIDIRQFPVPMSTVTATLKIVNFAADTISVRLGARGFGGGMIANFAIGQIRRGLEEDAVMKKAVRIDGTTIHADLSHVLPGYRQGLITKVSLGARHLGVDIDRPVPEEFSTYVDRLR